MNIGILGYGTMGGRHAKVLREFNRDAVSIYDDAEKQRDLAISNKYNTYDTLSEFLDTSDAIIISTPTKFHYENAMTCLEEGKHVLIEKPMCESEEDAIELRNKAVEENLVLAVDHPERHNPIIDFVYNEMGSPNKIIKRMRTERYGSSIPTSPHVQKDGIILDLGPHDIDNVLHFIGKMPKTVQAFGKYNDNDVEYAAQVKMLFDNKAEANCYFDWTSDIRLRRYDITTENTNYLFDLTNHTGVKTTKYEFEKPPSFEELTEANKKSVAPINLRITPKSQPLYHLHNDFIRATEDSENFKPKVTADDAIKVLKIIEAARYSAKNDNEVVHL